ncbi:MAG: FGGY family carbohydrate kinase [Trueperaceae bacterium]
MSELHLVFDIGTGGTKAALLTPSGEVVLSAFRGYETVRHAGGYAEQNPGDWWEAVVECALELAPSVFRRVTAVVLTGQMQNLTLLGEEGACLRPTILYSDVRATAEAAEIVGRLGASELRRRTGNDQGAAGLLAKLLWLKRHEPNLYVRAHRIFLGAADFVAYRLTGEAVTDSTTASTTGLLDLEARSPLSASLFEALGLERVPALLPSVREGGRLAGELLGSTASAMGLRSGTPVYLGPGDAGATTIGAGSGEIGPAYGYIGTSGWVALSAGNRADPDTGAITLAHPHRKRFIQIAPLLTAGGNLKWVRDLFADGFVDGSNGEPFSSVVEQALQRSPSRLLYLPYLAGERSPINDPLARGAFIGLDSSTTKAHLYRAVLEGIAYGYRHALQALAPGGIETLVLAGGGAKSAGWCQLFATIIGVKVIVGSAVEHVGVRGAHTAVRFALGEVEDYRFNIEGRDFAPVAEEREHYAQMFELYLESYPALRGVFRGLAGS